MKTLIKAFFLLIALTSAVPVLAQIFGPSNYEDCIIEGMQGVQSDLAAQAVMMACRQKFPAPQVIGQTSNSIGWQIEDNGIGRCYLLWDGSKFVEASVRVAPKKFTQVEMSTPRDTKVTFFIPQTLAPREGETEIEQVWRLSAYNFDNVYCGK